MQRLEFDPEQAFQGLTERCLSCSGAIASMLKDVTGSSDTMVLETTGDVEMGSGCASSAVYQMRLSMKSEAAGAQNRAG